MIPDRAQHLDPAGAARIPAPAMPPPEVFDGLAWRPLPAVINAADTNQLGPTRADVDAAYERGVAEGRRQLIAERAAALAVEDPGPAQPYDPSQVQIDVDTATPTALRAEVARLDLRLRWIYRHFDDQQTTHVFALMQHRDQRAKALEEARAEGRRQATEGHPDSYAIGVDRGFAIAIEMLRDDARYEQWWSALPQEHPDYGYWSQQPRRQFADYLATVGPWEPAEQTQPDFAPFAEESLGLARETFAAQAQALDPETFRQESLGAWPAEQTQDRCGIKGPHAAHDGCPGWSFPEQTQDGAR